MVMFYLTFLISCEGKPDYPIFVRSTTLEALSPVYAVLREGEVKGLKDDDNCTCKNVRLQYETIRNGKNSKR